MDLTEEQDGISVKFVNLIRQSRTCMSCTATCLPEVCQDALDFISDNIKIDRVLEEIFTNEAVPSDDLTEVTMESCLAYFESISHAASTPLKLVTSQVLAQKLIDVVGHKSDINHEDRPLLDENAKIKVDLLLNLMKKIITKNFDKVNFIKCLATENIPLEVVWLLDKEYLISFRSWLLSWCEDENGVEHFCASIKSLCCDESPSSAEQRRKIVQVLIGDLVQISYGETSPGKDFILKKTKEILSKTMEYVEKEAVSSLSDRSKNWLCLYKVIRELTDVSFDTIHTFFHERFNELLGRPCNVTVEEAFACQEKWTYERLSDYTITTYQQFILVFQNQAIIQTFERAVDSVKSEAVNVQVLAHLLTVFLIYVEEAFTLFDEFLGRRISESFENCDLLQLRLLLLLRRQAALEGNHVSPSYSSWFERTFVVNGLSLGLNTKRSIQFFYKLLSDLVPYERPEYLKVHVFKSPHVAVKFKYFVDDYVSLAKTRLADLNEPLENRSGIFHKGSGGVTGEQEKLMEQAQDDVDKVLKLYRESGRVPSSIMEASIFRKPYFIGRFLPALLIARKPPVEIDVKARLIEDLNRAGKIPPSMLRSYQKRCDNFEEHPSSDQPLDSIQRLVDSLEKLPMVVLNTLKGTEQTSELTSLLSSISRKLKLIFNDNVHENSPEVININLMSRHMVEDQIQASHVVMNMFCRACAAFRSVGTSESVQQNRDIAKFQWASKFVSMLVSFSKLFASLYVHLWGTVCHEPNLLQQEHIHGLSILVCHLASSIAGQSTSICLQSSTTSNKIEYYQSIADLLAHQIPLFSRSSVKFFIRCCCSYLQYALVAFETVTTKSSEVKTNADGGVGYVPEIMITKMQYLFSKLKFRKFNFDDPSFLDEKTWDILKVVMQSLDVIKLSQDVPRVKFDEWLVWELRSEDDFLLENERQTYYNWAIYEYFMSTSNQEDEHSMNYREVASQLFSVLMDHYSRSHENSRSTQTHLLKILQDIVYFIGCSHSNVLNENSKELQEDIWLLDCFFAHDNNEIRTLRDLHACSKMMAFLRLTMALPPWLLLENSEMDSFSNGNTKKLICFLNNNMKPYMFQGTFVVPFDFTAHLFKLFFPSTLKPETTKQWLPEQMFEKFARQIPLYYGSLLYYWNQLKPLYVRHMTKSGVLRNFNSYHQWLCSVFDGVEQRYGHHGVRIHTEDEPGFAYAIFLRLKKMVQDSSSLFQDVDSLVPRLTRVLDNLMDSLQGNKVILYLFDNLMSYLVDMICQSNKMGDKKVEFDISMAVLTRWPEVLHIFTQKCHPDSELLAVRSLLVPENFTNLLSIAFFRTFLYFPNEKLQQSLPCEAFTQALLVMYNEYSNLYKEFSESSKFPRRWEEIFICFDIPEVASRSKPLDLEFFIEVTKFVQEYLKTVSSNVLRSVPEELVTKSSADIQCFFSTPHNTCTKR